jgi:hypothetical protein
MNTTIGDAIANTIDMGTDAPGLPELAPEPTNRLAQPVHTNGTLAMDSIKFRIPGDQILKATAAYSDHVRESIRWASGYCRDRNISTADFGAMLRNKYGEPYSNDSVWKLFTGRREESELGPIIESIESLRRSVEEVMGHTSTGFIRTRLTDMIWRTCRRALLKHKLTFIFGESQIGKTTAITEFSRDRSNGLTTFVRMPTRGALGDFLEEVALRLGIPTQQKFRELRRRIIESFDERMLLIVDECHQCFSSHYSNRSLASLEFCREIHDRRKCGVVLVGTNVLRDGITRGPHSRLLRQLWLRGFAPLQLPDVPSPANLADFAKAFELDPAEEKIINLNYTDEQDAKRTIKCNPLELQTEVVTQWGLGRWLSILQQAAEDAKDESKPLTWGRVIRAHAQFSELENA